MMLAREPSCSRELLWRVELPSGGPKPDYLDRLGRAGFSPTDQKGGVIVLVGQGEHRLVLVPRTGRLQLRLHYLTPQPRRAAVAAELANSIVAAFR